MSDNFDKDLLKIINHYGVMPQLKYFQSEVFELNEAIINYEQEQNLKEILDIKVIDSDISKKQHIAEEISDVLVMLFQFKEFYHIDGNDILKIMDSKIKRQLDRIECENK